MAKSTYNEQIEKIEEQLLKLQAVQLPKSLRDPEAKRKANAIGEAIKTLQAAKEAAPTTQG